MSWFRRKQPAAGGAELIDLQSKQELKLTVTIPFDVVAGSNICFHVKIGTNSEDVTAEVVP